jgi:DNA-directed RNA polymerase beta subunit
LRDLGECEHESGAYFIINGSEKVIISQERRVEAC